MLDTLGGNTWSEPATEDRFTVPEDSESTVAKRASKCAQKVLASLDELHTASVLSRYCAILPSSSAEDSSVEEGSTPSLSDETADSVEKIKADLLSDYHLLQEIASVGRRCSAMAGTENKWTVYK